MFDIQATLEGDQALDAKFNQLSRQGSRRAMRAAITTGQKILVSAIRVKIPAAQTPGHDNTHFRDSVGSRFARSKQSGAITAKTGIEVGKNKAWTALRKTVPKGNRRAAYRAFRKARPGNPHFHLLAMGTALRRTKSGANRGLVKAGNYIPNAVASVQSTLATACEQKLRERIYAEATKEGK